MSKVIFTTLKIVNYSCIDNVIIPIDGAGACLIQGERLVEDQATNEINSNRDMSNGTGKTSIVEAFYWCITGEFFDSGTTMATVMNRFTDGDTCVQLIGHKDRIPFQIERRLESKTKRSASKVNHVLKFIVDNENIHEKTNSVSQTQEAINTFLSTNPLLLLNSRIVGQGEISSFTKVNDRQKKILIDNLVGLGICDRYLSASKKLYSEVCTSITAIDIELNNKKINLSRIQRDKEVYISEHAKWEEEQNNRITTARIDLHRLDKKLEVITEVINLIEASILDKQEQIKKYSTTNERLSTAKEISDTIDTLLSQSNVVHIDITKEFSYYQRSINEKQTELDKMTTNFTICPTCKQTITTNHLLEIRRQIESKISNDTIVQQNLTKRIKQLEPQLETYNELKARIKTIIDKCTGEIKLLDGLQRSVVVENSELYKQQLEKQVVVNERIAALKIISDGQHKTEDSPFLKMIDNCDKEINTLEIEIKEKLAQLTCYEEERLYYGLISHAFDKDGIPRLISTDALTIINSLIKRYTNRIFGNKFRLELKVKPRGKSEEIYPDIDNPEGGLTYARQSGGERKDIDLCQQFALREFSKMQDKSNFNVEFFDEVFAELDNHTSELFLDLIFEDNIDNIFIITHKDLCKEYFRNKITVCKKGNTSTVHINYANVNDISLTQ